MTTWSFMKAPWAPATFSGNCSGNLEQVFPSRFITSGVRLDSPASLNPPITSIDEDAGGEGKLKFFFW